MWLVTIALLVCGWFFSFRVTLSFHYYDEYIVPYSVGFICGWKSTILRIVKVTLSATPDRQESATKRTLVTSVTGNRYFERNWLGARNGKLISLESIALFRPIFSELSIAWALYILFYSNRASTVLFVLYPTKSLNVYNQLTPIFLILLTPVVQATTWLVFCGLLTTTSKSF